MKSCPKFHVKKQTLLAIAGCIWLIAGVNVARMGILAYQLITKPTLVDLMLSLVVFGAFGSMFFRMSVKHTERIHSYEEDTRSFWYFFDRKSYIIMICMMSFGIWLRTSGLVPSSFIAVFYTGLGAGLIFAGIVFWRMYLGYIIENNQI